MRKPDGWAGASFVPRLVGEEEEDRARGRDAHRGSQYFSATAQRKTLNEKQVDLLQWVRDGCPKGVYNDEHHRISAAALNRRGFLSVSGHGPRWRAELAQGGRDYLDRVEGTDPPAPRQANVSVTKELVDRVVAAGGSLVVPSKDWRDPDSIDYRRRARLAEQYGKVPVGKLLAVRNLPDGDLQIELVSGPVLPGREGEQKPIEVPDKVSRHHPAAKAFREGKDRHEVSKELVPRATRIVHVLAVEAETRGWEVVAPGPGKDSYGRESWTPSKNGHLAIKTEDERFWFRVREGKVHLRGPWEEEVHRHRDADPDSYWWRDREIPRGAYDADAVGKLELELFCVHYYTYGGRQSRWGDRQRWRLEDRLTDVVVEIEIRAAEATLRERQKRDEAIKAKQQAEEAARQREIDFEIHLKEAWRLLREARQAKELRAQASAWAEARALRAYCDAVEDSHGDDPEGRRWLEWARGFIEKLDPLDNHPALPEITEVPRDELQQYMPEGWSVQGAEYRDPRPMSGGFGGRV